MDLSLTSMANWSTVTHISLSAFYDVGRFKPLLILILLILFILIVFSNVLFLAAICRTRSLHRPMFVFLCTLFVNEVYGGSCAMVFLLVQIQNEVHIVEPALCYLQIFQVSFYVSVEFTNIAVISYDRYVAICFPLQYAARMTFRRVVLLVVLIWLPPFVAVTITTLLTASLTLCGNMIDEVYCDNYSIIKLACSDTTVNNWYELIAAAVTVILPLAVISFTYFQILRVCFRGSVHTRQKALTTCTPHICSLVNFAFGVSFEVIQTRFDMSRLPKVLRAFLPFYILTVQPLFNPLMYGLSLTQLRTACRRLLLTQNHPLRLDLD